MIVQIAVPELTDHPRGFVDYWLNVYLGQVKVGTNYQTHALAGRYMLSVEKAYAAYRSTRTAVEDVWAESADLRLGAHHRSIWTLEECVSSMHIAVRCMHALQHCSDLDAELRALISPAPKFVRDPAASTIRKARRAVQHMQEMIFKQEVPENAPFYARASGPDAPKLDEPGQTIKTIDRAEIGTLAVPFADLHRWLVEMCIFGDAIGRYRGAALGRPFVPVSVTF